MARLCVRYHERKAFATNASIRFFYRWMLDSAEEPDRDFIDTTARGETSTITNADNPNPIDSNFNPANGVVRFSTIWTEVAPLTRVVLELTQGNAAGRTWVALSADLQLRAV